MVFHVLRYKNKYMNCLQPLALLLTKETYPINKMRQNVCKNSSVADEWTVQFRKECVKIAPSYPFHFPDQESVA